LGSTCNVIKIKERKRPEPDGSARLSSALLPLIILSPSLSSFHPSFLALDVVPPPPSSCLSPPPRYVLPSLIVSFSPLVVSSPVVLRCRVRYAASCWPPLSHWGFAMPASCCPRRIALRWRLRYEEPSSLDRGRVVGPDLSSVLVLVGVGRRAVGIVDGWWCG